jgi:tetratricopeptide (TPR) repeat protein
LAQQVAAVARWASLVALALFFTSCSSVLTRPLPTANPAPAQGPTVTPPAMATSTPTITLTPTATPTPTLTSTATAAPTQTPAPRSWLLSPMSHEYQDWNNCGPVSAAMALSYYGIHRGQYEVAALLRPHKDDKHVEADEVIAYLRSHDLEAGYYVNGDFARLETLVAAGIPVVIQTWLNDRPTGHYRVARGFDRDAGTFIFNDPYYGPGARLSYAQLEDLWAPFNRCYIPVYRPEQAEAVCRILGPDCDRQEMYRRAAEAARKWTQRSPGDPYAWFSLGDDLLALGDAAGAVEAYARAQEIGLPPRMLWYRFGPFEALLGIGAYHQVLALSEPILEDLASIAELHAFRGRAYEGLGERDQAVEAYRLAFEYHTNLPLAVQGLQRLQIPLPLVPTITPTR